METTISTAYTETMIRFTGAEASYADETAGAATGWIPAPSEADLAALAEEYTTMRVLMFHAQRLRNLVAADDPRFAIADAKYGAYQVGLSAMMMVVRMFCGVDTLAAISAAAMRAVAADDLSDADLLAAYEEMGR